MTLFPICFAAAGTELTSPGSFCPVVPGWLARRCRWSLSLDVERPLGHLFGSMTMSQQVPDARPVLGVGVVKCPDAVA